MNYACLRCLVRRSTRKTGRIEPLAHTRLTDRHSRAGTGNHKVRRSPCALRCLGCSFGFAPSLDGPVRNLWGLERLPGARNGTEHAERTQADIDSRLAHVAARADLIVSGDRHLLDLGGEYQGIRIVSPAQAVAITTGG
jgi:hypothetical protein